MYNFKQKIIIEPLMRDFSDREVEKIEVFCFDSNVEFILKTERGYIGQVSLYDKKLNISDDLLMPGDINVKKKPDDLINQSIDLSVKLSKDFKFVRVDWIIYKKRLYFEELTFTPHSGFHRLNHKFNKKFGELIKLEI